ncbi:MAG: phosphoglycerate mutase family protein [Bacteroidales bacterium]|jgi:hypothetical protein|nr:phosphoglycerate mutase family protein [Bacteroidales bacterium]
MEISDIFELSRGTRQSALKVLKALDVVNICHGVGATVNIVGSLKTDLMMDHLDIDLHVYTDEPMVKKSFSFMEKISENKAIKNIQYKNLLDTEEECIEWHAWYEHGDKRIWKLDIIHIRKGSCYDGFVEKVTDKIIKQLTPETKEAILRIKYEMTSENNAQGIQIYYAVLEQGIRNYSDFAQWQKENPMAGILKWI